MPGHFAFACQITRPLISAVTTMVILVATDGVFSASVAESEPLDTGRFLKDSRTQDECLCERTHDAKHEGKIRDSAKPFIQ